MDKCLGGDDNARHQYVLDWVISFGPETVGASGAIITLGSVR